MTVLVIALAICVVFRHIMLVRSYVHRNIHVCTTLCSYALASYCRTAVCAALPLTCRYSVFSRFFRNVSYSRHILLAVGTYPHPNLYPIRTERPRTSSIHHAGWFDPCAKHRRANDDRGCDNASVRWNTAYLAVDAV